MSARGGERTEHRVRRLSLGQFASVHASFHNHFNQERRLVSRDIYKERRSAALAEWRQVASWSEVGIGDAAAKWRQVAVGLTAPQMT